MPIEAVSPTVEEKPSLKANLSNTHEASKEPSFSYQEFLGLLKKPESKTVVTTIRKFIEAYRSDYSKNLTVLEQIEKYKEYRDNLAESLHSHHVWIAAGEDAQILAVEGIEYMTMNQIHSKAFCPYHSDDYEKDEAIYKKICLYRWVEAKHLGVSEDLTLDEKLAEQSRLEISKINDFSTPRDKLICLMNAVKILEKAIQMPAGSVVNADIFIPFLILTILKSCPERLYSNLHYISRFRNQKFLANETGYKFTHLMASLAFIQKMDKQALVVTEAEYNEQMEVSVARFNEESKARRLEEERKHHEEMARREAEMIASDHAKEEQFRKQRQGIQGSSSTELKTFLIDLEENGKQMMDKLKRSSFAKKSKSFLDDFVSEAKTAIKELVDDDEELQNSNKIEKSRKQEEEEDEEQFQMQLALALSISEAEAKEKGILNSPDKGKEKDIDVGQEALKQDLLA